MENQEYGPAVRRMLECIENHISEPITLKMLADAAWYSPWHCARVFKEVTGLAPFTFIRRLRLTKAAKRLREGDEKVIDVAFDFVFDSHEGFTRAFSRQFGMPPTQFRTSGFPIPVFIPSGLGRRLRDRQLGEVRMEQEKKLQAVFTQVVDRPARKVIVKFAKTATEYFTYCEEVGCDDKVWNILAAVKDALNEPIGMWMPANLRKEGTSEYIQGVEVALDYKGLVPDGFEMIELPACKMMVFQGPPYEDVDYEEAITDLWEVMKTFDPKLYGFEWADADGPRFQLSPMGYRGYIEARPVRSL
jgi:AraC family transcriptional regulator